MASWRIGNDRLIRFEPALFLLILLAHLLVLFRFEWYPTLDGPAHLYNANLIKQLLGGDRFLAQFLEFSSFPEPNWSGHAIMAALSTFLPANWVEKGLVGIIFIGTALGFRSIWKALAERAPIGSVLIFPFLCAYTLRIGFFNFSISIVALLICIAYGLRGRESTSVKRIIGLSILFGIVYFSNALTTLIAIGAIIILIGIDHYRSPKSRSKFWRTLLPVLLASFPWLLLIAFFLLRHSTEGATASLPFEQLIAMWWNGSVFTFQTGTSMVVAARVITLCLATLFILALIERLRNKGPRSIAITDGFVLIAFLSLVAFFILPDKAASGSIISIRYFLFVHLFLALWIASQRWTLWMQLLIVPFVIADLWLVRADHHFTGELNDAVIEMRSVLPNVKSGSIVLPLLYTDNWLHSNFSNYLGTERSIMVIDNYEAMTPHFPLRWKDEHRAPNSPRSFFNSNRPCIAIDSLERSMQLRFDHVLRWQIAPGIQDSCTTDLTAQLVRSYHLSYRSMSNGVELHELKNRADQ
nr:hypothetical protein [Bacteroidota bacterium]